MIDYKAQREAIGLLLETVPGVRVVEPYTLFSFGNNDLPLAMIWLGPLDQPDLNSAGGQLGGFEYDTVWTIRVYWPMAGVGSEVEAQRAYEAYLPGFRNAFDAGQQLTLGEPSGRVQASVIARITPIPDRDREVFTLEATLLTQSFA